MRKKRIAKVDDALVVYLKGYGTRGSAHPCNTLAEASKACREFIDEHNLGASTWEGGEVFHPRSLAPVAVVSYNGRVWQPGEWNHDTPEFQSSELEKPFTELFTNL